VNFSCSILLLLGLPLLYSTKPRTEQNRKEKFDCQYNYLMFGKKVQRIEGLPEIQRAKLYFTCPSL
jgi:hypothetical protein